ncbi:Uncharacterised protein [Bacteroides xylanisolvens]|nr:Uncharacterised protein [Bacteroides xylanisolvens]
MIHEREGRKACCHTEAAIRRVQEGDVHLKERRTQPEDEEGEGGKGVVLDPRPEYKGRQHLVLHEKDQSHDQKDEDRPAIHQCNRHTHLAWKKRHRRLGNHYYYSLSQVIRFAKTRGEGSGFRLVGSGLWWQLRCEYLWGDARKKYLRKRRYQRSEI